MLSENRMLRYVPDCFVLNHLLAVTLSYAIYILYTMQCLSCILENVSLLVCCNVFNILDCRNFITFVTNTNRIS